MDQVRGEAGVSLKRLYREFPSKDQLIEAYLLRRDTRWLDALRAAVAPRVDTEPPDPRAEPHRAAAERILRAYDWLGDWFAEPGFRGCAFTNSFGELGTESSTVAAIAAAHKAQFRAVFVGLASELEAELAHPVPAELGEQLYLLAEGAVTAAGISGDVGTARTAWAAAAALMAAAEPRPVEPPVAQQSGGRFTRVMPFRLLRRRAGR
jgi:AcrR family transcriptional regulator